MIRWNIGRQISWRVQGIRRRRRRRDDAITFSARATIIFGIVKKVAPHTCRFGLHSTVSAEVNVIGVTSAMVSIRPVRGVLT